jgi:hypothetical protein
MGKQKDRLSRDVVSQLKLYSFNNVTELYKRHQDQFGIALTTFYKAMEGDYLGTDIIDRITAFATTLKLTPDGINHATVVHSLLCLLDKFDESGKLEDWKKVQVWMQNFREIVDVRKSTLGARAYE